MGYFPRMEREDDSSIDRLLQRWHEGEEDALARLLPLVYADLRRIAGRILRSTPDHPTLQATALVHEVFLRLLGREAASFEDTAHLLNTAARMMRQVLVDRARKSASKKGGGRWQRDAFAEALELPIPDSTDLFALNEALDQLESTHQRMAQVVQLRYFVGLEVREVAGVLGINERTAQRDWAAARAWLQQKMGAIA